MKRVYDSLTLQGRCRHQPLSDKQTTTVGVSSQIYDQHLLGNLQ